MDEDDKLPELRLETDGGPLVAVYVISKVENSSLLKERVFVFVTWTLRKL